MGVLLFMGSVLTPFSSCQWEESLAQAKEVREQTEPSLLPEASVSATPSATTSGGGVTPAPSVRPDVTPKPIVTPNPGFSPLLGNSSDERVTLTIGEKGHFGLYRGEDTIFNSSDLKSLVRLVYQSENTGILQLDADGNYQAVGIGKVSVSVIGYCEESEWQTVWDEEKEEYVEKYVSLGEKLLFTKTFTIYVYPDMSAVTMEKDSVVIYHVSGYYDDSSVSIKINSEYVLDEDDEVTYLETASSNKKMVVQCSLNKNVLKISCNDSGTTDVTVTINGRPFVIHVKVVMVKISSNSLLLAQHKVKKLKVKGYSGKLKWKSSRPAVASVNSEGKVRAKKQGNSVISAKLNGCKIGCVVSVVSKKKKKVISRAVHIGKTGKYSQAKRMKKGFYDCSSLVWRSYKAFGIHVASRSYAPTAADMARWCAGRRRLLKGGYSRKNLNNLKINAGDLLFETGRKNGRYLGIYHVEMFIGYVCYGFDNNGKPMVAAKWANRPDGYYSFGCGVVGRM